MVRRLKPGEASELTCWVGRRRIPECRLTDNCLNSALAPFPLSNSLEGGNFLNGQKPDLVLSVFTLCNVRSESHNTYALSLLVLGLRGYVLLLQLVISIHSL